jgi:hypothetical protein
LKEKTKDVFTLEVAPLRMVFIRRSQWKFLVKHRQARSPGSRRIFVSNSWYWAAYTQRWSQLNRKSLLVELDLSHVTKLRTLFPNRFMVIAAPRLSGCAVSHWPRPTIKCATTKNDLERVGEKTANSCYGEEPHGFFRKSNLSSPRGFAYCPSRRGFVLLVDSKSFEIRNFLGDFILWYFVFIGH